MLQDLRFALRLFARQRGFFATAVLTIALGVSLSATVFAVVDGVLFRPLPTAIREACRRVWHRPRRAGSHDGGVASGTVGVARGLACVCAARGVQRRRTARSGSWGRRIAASPHGLGHERLPPDAGRRRRSRASPAGRGFRARGAARGHDLAQDLDDRLWWRGGCAGPHHHRRRPAPHDRRRIPRAFVFPMPQRRFAPDVVVPFAAAPADAASRTTRYLYLIGRLAAESPVPRAQADIDAMVRRSQPPVGGSASMPSGVSTARG